MVSCRKNATKMQIILSEWHSDQYEEVTSRGPGRNNATEVDDDSVFDVDCPLFFGQEGPYPAVLIGLCAVPAVVLIRRDDQLLGRVVANGIGRSIAHEPARKQLPLYRFVDCPLLLVRVRAPQLLALRAV